MVAHAFRVSLLAAVVPGAPAIADTQVLYQGYSDGTTLDISSTAPVTLSFNLAPPLFARLGADGRPRKIRFGPWLRPLLQGLARARGLRGRWLDPFRYGADRALDRQLLADYEADLELLAGCPELPERHGLAAWPEQVRGYGPVRAEAARRAAEERLRLRQALGAIS